MAETDSGNAAKAQVFFDRGQQAAGKNNFDYAIDMYLEGLKYDPDALEQGHLRLYELALMRQGKDGKKPSMMERMKRLRGKNPLEQMLNAEYLFAKDPDHLPYAEAMLKAAAAGGYRKTTGWIANLVFQENNAAKRPSASTYVLLKDAYKSIGQFDKAIVACQRASKLKPEDAELADEFKNLTAELTMSRGRYDQEGDFRQSIKDREVQERLQSQKAVVKTEDYRQTAIDDARKEYALDPNLPKNIFNLADALSELQNDKGEKEAIELLEKAYKTKNDFSYKQRAGQISMKRLRRKVRKAKAIAEARPGDDDAKMRLSQWNAKLNSVELEHYRLCVENYPTDLQAKYEYGNRLVRNKKFDDAIPLFQEAQKDPRHKIASMDKIGLCFFYKGWYADAIDIFTQAIDAYEIKDDGVAKELRYNLARSYEQKGETDKALEIYRKIAQLDFGYRDVRQRVDKIRGQGTGPGTGQDETS
jgi:tetratricopeptide (TPR) repeat protein